MTRGRPKKISAKVDFGTAELFQKRVLGITKEPLDLCLERGIINGAEHAAGLTLRRLFVLKHGTPGLQSKDYSKLKGRGESKYNDQQWLSLQQSVYADVLSTLKSIKCDQSIMDVCIYSIMPSFLINMRHNKSILDLMIFKDGMSALLAELSEYTEILKSRSAH